MEVAVVIVVMIGSSTSSGITDVDGCRHSICASSFNPQAVLVLVVVGVRGEKSSLKKTNGMQTVIAIVSADLSEQGKQLLTVTLALSVLLSVAINVISYTYVSQVKMFTLKLSG